MCDCARSLFRLRKGLPDRCWVTLAPDAAGGRESSSNSVGRGAFTASPVLILPTPGGSGEDGEGSTALLVELCYWPEQAKQYTPSREQRRRLRRVEREEREVRRAAAAAAIAAARTPKPSAGPNRGAGAR